MDRNNNFFQGGFNIKTILKILFKDTII